MKTYKEEAPAGKFNSAIHYQRAKRRNMNEDPIKQKIWGSKGGSGKIKVSLAFVRGMED